MYKAFEELPETSRVWIYQSERPLTEEETGLARQLCRRFVEQWTAHKVGLEASFDILHKRFLVLAVDESAHGASGCSIDSSVRFIQELGRKFNTSFLDRRVPFELEGEIIPLTTAGIREKIEEGILTEDTPFYNNLVPDIRGLRNEWKSTAGDGWVKRMFVNKKAEAK